MTTSRPLFLLLSLLLTLSLPTLISSFATTVAPPAAKKTAVLPRPKVNVIAGASGYIGKSVVRESVLQGYKTIALVRDADKVRNDPEDYMTYFRGAEIVECDVTNSEQLTRVSFVRCTYDRLFYANPNLSHFLTTYNHCYQYTINRL